MVKKKVLNIFGEVFKSAPPAGTTFTIIHDPYSAIWLMPFAIIKKELERGSFAIITNYTTPVQNIIMSGEQVGLDIKKELENDNLAIIDVFGSRYGVKCECKNLFYIDNVAADTINPKLELILEQHIKPLVKDRRIVRVVYTLDGAALMFGEKETLRLLNQTLALERKYRPNSIFVLPLTKKAVSESFTTWVARISDYVIVTSTRLNGVIEEYLYVVKSLEEGFVPTSYLLHITRDKSPDRLRAMELGGIKPYDYEEDET